MGWFGGLCSAVSNAIGSFCSGVGGVISRCVSGLANALSVVGSAISGAISGIIKGIANIIGISDERERPEELALKAEKSDKSLEDFDSFEEYKSYLDKIELTKEDMLKLNDKDNLEAYSIIGTGIYLQGINEHYGMNINPKTLVTLYKELGIKTPEDTKEFLDKCKENGVSPDLAELEEGGLTRSEEDKLISTLKDSVMNMSNKDDISQRLDKMLEQL